MDEILAIIGTSPATIGYTRSYLSIFASGSVFVIISNCFCNIIRAEGKSTEAMMGLLIGNLVNCILDPIMILWFGWGVAGAAIATVIGNAIGVSYYIIYFLRGKSILSINIKDFSAGNRIFSGVLSIGVPASINSILVSVSNVFVNILIVNYGDMAVAGIGVAFKVVLVNLLLVIGVGQGVQPILGYCYGAGNWERFKGVMRFSLIFATVLGIILSVISYLGAGVIVKAFLEEPSAYRFGVQFSRMLLISGPCLGALFIYTNALQAVGAAVPSLILSVSRQGIIFIPILFILNAVAGLTGLVIAQPVTDFLSFILSTVLYFYATNTLSKKSTTVYYTL